jgi:acyl carrier protein
MTDTIITELSTYISNDILKQPKKKLGEDDALISRGIIDSFHLVDLAMFVEEHFGVRLDDAELNADTFDTLSQLAALIRERQS